MNTDFLKGYRTLAFNILSFVLLALTGLTGQVSDPDTLRYIAIGVTVVNFLLRLVTSTAPGKSV